MRRPESRRLPSSSARRGTVRGAVSEGFTTTAFPQAKATPAFHPKIIAGMFQGTIAPQTPSGFRTTFMYPYFGRTAASPRMLPVIDA
ncbi:MAG: hypothetical protein MJ014_04810 [Methanocorpusculum sp.]|nr:hypothetical protein [Methanocorpusculum sp.]